MVIQISNIKKSPRENKRFRVYLNNDTFYDFGFKGGETYIDHNNKEMRWNYRARHLANESENQLIKNVVPSPALFSYYLLWGPSTNIEKNIKFLNSLLK
jgi:hypothetical protein